LGATEIHKVREVSELLPDFDLVSYGGLDIKDYPIWHCFDLKGFTFLHRVCLKEFGYVVEDETDELPKFTSGSANGGRNIVDLKMDVQAIDRFACRIVVRGQLLGSSIEMNMEIAFDFLVAGFRGPSTIWFLRRTRWLKASRLKTRIN
jgi:hypothetical protein